jgi:phage gp45-like
MSVDLFRAELSDAIDDSGDLQLLKKMLGYDGEELTQVHRVQTFGFHSMPPVGSHGIGLALRGMRDLVVALGMEHPEKRPKNRDPGSTAIYDQWGNIVSLVEKEIRIVNATKITLKAPSIVLEGTVKLGGDDAGTPASMKGTVDSHGDTDVGNFATKVLMK